MSVTLSPQIGADPKKVVCPPSLMGNHLANAPVSLSGMEQVNGASVYGKAVDGVAGNWVQCSVVPDGDKYRVNAEIISSGVDATGSQVTSDLFARVTIGKGQQEVLGAFHLSDGATEPGRYVSEVCLFSVQPDGAANARLGISPGRIWARVHCAQIDDMRNFTGNECGLDGYLKFDDCTQ